MVNFVQLNWTMKKADLSAVATFTLITLLHTWSHAVQITPELEAAILNCTNNRGYVNTSLFSQSANSSGNVQCLACHSECTKCYGPSFNQCYECRESSLEVRMEGVSSGSGSGCDLVITNDVLVRDTSQTVITCESTDSPLSKAAIIGIAVGGAAVLVAVLCLCLCVCCLCCRARRRKRASFIPMTEVKEQFPSLDNKDLTVNKAKLEGTSNGTKSQEHHVLQEQHIVLPVVITGEGGATNHQQETVLTRAITPPPTFSESLKEKGYIPMSSAGSIRSSKSMGDINNNSEEQDIYVEPVELSGAYLRPTPPATNKPPVLPKPAGLTPIHKNTTASSPASRSHSPAHPQTVERPKSMEEYVAPDVFREDREKQELIDSYYNSETIESIRLNRDPAIAVLDPSQASLYVNFDQPTSSHSLKAGSQRLDSPDDGLQNVKDFLGTTTADESTKGGYYNVAESTLKQSTESDYNYVEHDRSPKHGMESLEDDQYIYMKSGHHSGVDQIVSATPPSPSTRHQSEPGKKIHKYINLPYDQSGHLVVNGHSTSKEGGGANTSPRKDDVLAEVTFLKTSSKPKPRQKPMNVSSVSQSSVGAVVNGAPQEVEGDEEQPLYVNLKPDEEDEGGEELYENVR